MSGEVSADGEPIVRLQVAGTDWIAVIDTGFNGHLDLPLALKPHVNAVFYADQDSILADGSIIKDAIYEFDFPFVGHMVRVYASFSPVNEILSVRHCWTITASKSTSRPAPSCSSASRAPDPHSPFPVRR